MTHVSIHRCRFIDYPPSQITALSFSHPSTPSSHHPPPRTLRLAIGRTNGSIEIWNPLDGSWLHESTLQGGKDRSIEGLTWTQDYDADGRGLLRLFSIGYSSVVTEWDLGTGRPRAHIDCNGGIIWSIAAQPRDRSVEDVDREGEEACAQQIVVGTEDGSLAVFSTAGGPGAMSYVKTLMRAGTNKSRVLSLVWQNKHTVVAGMADSAIRVWDVRTGRASHKLSLNRDRGREVLVWAVRALPNGDLVSADSRGEICFWDGKRYALKQRIKSHEGDCLALEVGGIQGDTVISGGIDMKTVLHKYIGSGRKWGQVGMRRFHKHDVRAMAAYECGRFSVIASGGVDMTPIIVPLREFLKEAQLTISAVPQTPIVVSVPESRLVMSWWEREVKIWRIEELGYDGANKGDELYLLPAEEEGRGRKLLSRIILSNDEYITSAAISSGIPGNGGHILAVSTIAEIKLFLLRPPKPSSGSDALRITKIPIPPSLPLEIAKPHNSHGGDEEEIDLAKEGARIVSISPDRKWLSIITPDSRVLIVGLSILCSPPSKRKGRVSVSIAAPILEIPRQERSWPPPPLIQAPSNQTPSKKHPKRRAQRVDEGTLGAYTRAITKLTFSSTSRTLAASDISGHLDTFILPTSETWILNPSNPLLPKLHSAVSVMVFRPPTPSSQSEDRLLLLTSKDHHLLEFHISSGKLSDWSRRNPPTHLSQEFLSFKDRACGAYFESSEWQNRERLWIWSTSWLCMFDLSRDLPPPTALAEKRGKKRKAESGAGELKKRTGGLMPGGPTITAATTSSELQPSNHKPITDSEWEGEREEGVYANTTKTTPARKPHSSKTRGVKSPFWSSHRYKNLLGFLPVGIREEVLMKGPGWGRDEVLEAMEMVVVERPTWDIKMPPRFYKGAVER